MRIVQVTDVIHAGGAETFVLRLAQALYQQGHEVRIYVFYEHKIDRKVAQAIAPDVVVDAPAVPFMRLRQLLDGLLLKLKIDYSFVNGVLQRRMRRYLKQYKPDVIHGHLFTADWVSVAASRDNGIPVVATMHGDYALYYRKLKEGIHIRIRNYIQKQEKVLNTLKEIVCISDEQLAYFKQVLNKPYLPLHKIYNGYAVSQRYQKRSRAECGIPDNAFVFGMVARGIPEKGWEAVIESFMLLNRPGTYLLLVGDSEYVQGLKAKYTAHRPIIFAGYSSNPIEFVELFDAGLFASTFFAESLPTVVIEYLACNVPVVCVDIAECKNMLDTEKGSAGIMVSLKEGGVDNEAFAQAMGAVATDQALYHQLEENTALARTKFDMQHCVSQYVALYEKHTKE